MTTSAGRLFLALGLHLCGLSSTAAQQNHQPYRGGAQGGGGGDFGFQNPRMESRVFGAAANIRNQALEGTPARYPGPFRLLVAGDDHVHGCGFKSFPPLYSYANCSDLDEGFRVSLVKQVREATSYEVHAVGSRRTPASLDETLSRHEGRPGKRIDEVAALVDWAGLGPDLVVLLAGRTDLAPHDTAAAMEKRYEAMLISVQRALPNARTVVASVLDLGTGTQPEVRHNLDLFNRVLPNLVARRRSAANMDVFYVDLAPLGLCKEGSGLIAGSVVPRCTSGEQNPTGVGYGDLATRLAQSLAEVVALEGNCRFHPQCQDDEVRKWRNQIDGGLRVVSRYSK
jgi:hypothetical protein